MNQEILSICMERGILLDKSVLDLFSSINDDFGDIKIVKSIIGYIESKYKQKIITKSLFINNINKLKEIFLNYDEEIQKALIRHFSNFGIDLEIKGQTGELLKEKALQSEDINFLKIYQILPKKIEVDDFVKNLRYRFNFLKNLLQQRTELDGLTSINKIDTSRNYSIIGIIYDKRNTKNDNVLLEVEDLTGKINAVVNKNRLEVYEKSKEVLLDEVVGLKCSGSREILFVNDIIFPDIKIIDKKKSKKEEIVAFTSDVHVGSNEFLEENFLKFIEWINGNIGNEKQRQEAFKVKYLFIVGDTIDGVGIYPGQENKISIKDVNDQYKKLTELLLKIRPDVNIIMCAGQHDAVRVAEPQPVIGEHYGNSLYILPNLYLVTNPSLVEIGSDVKFKVLMYHGASMHGIINSIDKLRLSRAQDHPTEVVKYMLKKRHLAPSHSLTTYTPCEKEDPLLISEVPDIFVTGDLHRPEVGDYNGVFLVSGSCWQSITPFEEKIGNNPDPCKVPIFNLKTREVKILDFSDVCEKEESCEKVLKNNDRDNESELRNNSESKLKNKIEVKDENRN